MEFSCIINTVIKEFERICGGANIKSFRQWRGVGTLNIGGDI